MAPSRPDDAADFTQGSLTFSIESRLIRELGERLVRQPEVALLELVKNAYDADADTCWIEMNDRRIRVRDDGNGMTFEQFSTGWMRIGTSSKNASAASPRYGRPVTGEKGIGRFAVRYLGQRLLLASIAYDPIRQKKTRLIARFDWSAFDRNEDLGKVSVPYRLSVVDDDAEEGTILSIGDLRPSASAVDWRALRTGSMGVVSPIRSLLKDVPLEGPEGVAPDPGFRLEAGPQDKESDLADEILRHFALRATIEVTGQVITISILKPKDSTAYLTITDTIGGLLDGLTADIRFFPRRQGIFAGASFDGRNAYTWIRENAGIKVFDRGFQMRPYGMPGDDWLNLTADTERNLREPASSIMQKHYPMDQATKSSTATNWMLRMPSNMQVIGVVQVQGRREAEGQDEGLVAAADREGFLQNHAFWQLTDIVRGAVEALGYADREISLEEARLAAEAKLAAARAQMESTIRDVQGDSTFTPQQRTRIINILQETQQRSERLRIGEKEREQQLEIMSLLGVVSGFMTHEFGVALSELQAARKEMEELSHLIPSFAERAKAFDEHIDALKGFVRYSRAYIEGVRAFADKPYPARPRFLHVAKAFSGYAEKRGIEVAVEVDADVMAPRVPPALYDGIAQNLLTNALKAVNASDSTVRKVVFRAWNDGQWHHLQVSDTGSGVPSAIKDFIFDPLFTTTNGRSSDPLGSGMGLGLALVRRGAQAFGGVADLVNPPPGYSTCVEVRFPRVLE